MNINEWINNPKTIEKSKKSYAHFDFRTDLSKSFSYVTDSKKIASHSFYPFIHYEMKSNKYNKHSGKKTKIRDICYASHIDRCIFQYYSYLLNDLYNKRLKVLGIDNIPVAYRTDLHKNNIHYSKMAFDFIRQFQTCYIMIGDFTGFFDNLDHDEIKKQWCSLLNCTTLPADHYAVFKNITKYSIWELDDILRIREITNTESNLRILNRQKLVLTQEQFKRNRHCIKKNKKSFQIPQGSPISAVLANIYMIDADKEIFDYAQSLNGFYMRYSDDFIVVIPESNISNSPNVFEPILKILCSVKNLDLQPNKTQIFKIVNGSIENVGSKLLPDADTSKNTINFLGFTYDGTRIYIRPKTTSKYYYRMYRKAKSIANNPDKKGSDNLYRRYSIHGAKSKPGNFFTYVSHADEIYGENEDISVDFKRHMSKIRKALNSKRDY